MALQKAPRNVYGFTKKAGIELAETISKNNFNHYVQVEKIENNVATLNIHKFKTGKGKSAKDYQATVNVLRTHNGNIASFTDFKLI